MARTSTTANAVLGLLALREEWSTWELTKQLRRNLRFFWPRAESRIYEETRRLGAKGLASTVRSFVGRRGRTVYSITPAGLDEVRRWLAMPPKPTALECEPLLRVVLSDLGTAEQAVAALDQIRADARAILEVGAVVAGEYLTGSAEFQDQVHVRALLFDFLSSFALMLSAWADRAEERINGYVGSPQDEREEAAKVMIRNALAAYPADLKTAVTSALAEARGSESSPEPD